MNLEAIVGLLIHAFSFLLIFRLEDRICVLKMKMADREVR